MVTSCHPDEDVNNPRHPDFCGRKYWEKKAGDTWDDPQFLSAVGYEVWHILRHINPLFRLNEAIQYPLLKFVRDYIDARLYGDSAKEFEAAASDEHDIRDYSWLDEYLPKATKSSYWE